MRVPFAAFAMVLGYALFPPAAAQAQVPTPLGGPVIIGGDDADDHGFFSGENQSGWLYIEDGFNNIGPAVANGNRLAVCIGCNGSQASSAFASGFDRSDLPGQGWTRITLTSTVDIQNFFAGTGTTTLGDVGILYMPANGPDSFAGTAGGISFDQLAVVNASAEAIDAYVNAGGGLFAHDQRGLSNGFGWLTTLLPGIVVNGASGCFDRSLALTARGSDAFPQLTDAIVSGATPWHSFFTGGFGGLDVLVTGPCGGVNEAVIIGGADVVFEQFIDLEPQRAFNSAGSTHRLTAELENESGDPIADREVFFEVTTGPNVGTSGAVPTDSVGLAAFAYNDLGGPGVDTIKASFVDDEGATVFDPQGPALAFWDADCNGNDTPDTCDASCAGFEDACSEFTECGTSADGNENLVPDECEVVVHPAVSFAPGWGEGIEVRSTLEPVGTFAYVAAQKEGLRVYDVTNPAQPSEGGTYFPDPVDCVSEDVFFDAIAVRGDTAYVAGGRCGLFIIDVSSAQEPDLVQRFPGPTWAKDVAVRGNLVYVADYFQGLWVVDVSNPATPVQVGTTIGLPGQALAVRAGELGDRIYVATTDGLFVLDPAASHAQVGAFQDLVDGVEVPQDVGIHVGPDGKRTAYLPVWQGGLLVLDVTNAASISVKESIVTELAFYKVAASGAERVYVTEGLCGLAVFDRTDDGLQPAALTPVENPIPIAGGVSDCSNPSEAELDQGAWAWAVHQVASTVYVSFGRLDPREGGLQIFQFPASVEASASRACGLLGVESLLVAALLVGRGRRRRGR